MLQKKLKKIILKLFSFFKNEFEFLISKFKQKKRGSLFIALPIFAYCVYVKIMHFPNEQNSH